MVKICPNCGIENDDSAKWCKKCITYLIGNKRMDKDKPIDYEKINQRYKIEPINPNNKPPIKNHEELLNQTIERNNSRDPYQLERLIKFLYLIPLILFIIGLIYLFLLNGPYGYYFLYAIGSFIFIMILDTRISHRASMNRMEKEYSDMYVKTGKEHYLDRVGDIRRIKDKDRYNYHWWSFYRFLH